MVSDATSDNAREADLERLVVGEGQFRYEPVANWAKLPPGRSINEVGSVGVDSRDNVYVFNRGPHPMMVFDRHGNFLRSWGENVFRRPHGVHVAPDDTLWLTDDGDHTVRHCSTDGTVLLEIGIPGVAVPYMSGRPFNRCTHTALSPEGDLYVSDGYGNARVHKYSPQGRLLMSWGEPGTDPGQFNIVHNITCDEDGWVYVADRENHRVQVFDGKGRYQSQWNNLHRPNGLFMPRGKCPICYIAEGGSSMAINRDSPNLGARVTIVDNTGKRIGRFGGPLMGFGPAEFVAPHGICVDSRGDIYVGEVPGSSWSKRFPGQERPKDLSALKKFRKVGDAAAAEAAAGIPRKRT